MDAWYTAWLGPWLCFRSAIFGTIQNILDLHRWCWCHCVGYGSRLGEDLLSSHRIILRHDLLQFITPESKIVLFIAALFHKSSRPWLPECSLLTIARIHEIDRCAGWLLCLEIAASYVLRHHQPRLSLVSRLIYLRNVFLLGNMIRLNTLDRCQCYPLITSKDCRCRNDFFFIASNRAQSHGECHGKMVIFSSTRRTSFYSRTGTSLKTPMAANLVPERGGCAWPMKRGKAMFETCWNHLGVSCLSQPKRKIQEQERLAVHPGNLSISKLETSWYIPKNIKKCQKTSILPPHVEGHRMMAKKLTTPGKSEKWCQIKDG